MKQRKFTLIDTRCTGGYSYDDYVDYCEGEGIEPADEDSREYWGWIYDMKELDTGDFFSNLRWARETGVIIFGSCGLWYGRREIKPVYCNSTDFEKTYDGRWRYMNPALRRAIQKCINNVDDFKVEYDNGVINVYGYHHDGTNCFSIRPLSKKGEKIVENNGGIDFINGEPVEREVKEYMLAKFKETDIGC